MKVTRNIDTGDEKQTIRTISTKPKEHFEGRWKSGRLYPLYSVVVNNGTTFISQNAKMKEEPYVIYDADKKEFKAPDGWLIKEMSADSRVTALGGGGDGGVTPEEVEEMIKDKVDKVDGKGLSTNDYDDTEKNKVASAYQKPNNGIPKSDLAKAVQDVLDDADGAYKKPVTGIPFADLADGVQDSLSNADEAKAGLAGKQDTISDLQTIRTGAAAGATAYQKPSGGVPKSDLASSVQTSLGKADTAIQPAEFNELKDEVDTIGNGAYEEAWDGSSAPVVADIPAGVSVTYNSTSYTGTLAASASTVDKIYLVSDGNGNYDRYVTIENSGTYSWKKVGTTAIPLSDYATKTEVSQLEAEVDDLDGQLNGESETIITETQYSLPGYIAYSGGAITNTGSSWIHSDIIPLADFVEAGQIAPHGSVAGVAFYNGTSFSDYISGINYPTIDNYLVDRKITKEAIASIIPANATHIAFSTDSSQYTLKVKTQTIVTSDGLVQQVEDIADTIENDIEPSLKAVEEDINGVESPTPQQTQYSEAGYIKYTDGSIVTGNTWIHSPFIPIDDFISAAGFVFNGSVASAAFYSAEDRGAYISGFQVAAGYSHITINKTDLTIPAGAKYISFSTNGDTDTLVVTTAVVIKGLKERVADLENGETPVAGLSKKCLHFSFDDTIAAFYDIAHNNRASIFDNAFFGALKNLHDTYGAVFSCYCFLDYFNLKWVSKLSTIVNPDTTAVYFLGSADGEYAANTWYVYRNSVWTVFTDALRDDYKIFSLSSMPSTWASEFSANSAWLKFGLHGRDGMVNYQSATAEEATTDYNSFISSIVTITGTVECVDTVVRLQNFAGNVNVVRAMRDADLGVQGFLCSDYSETSGGSGGSSGGYIVSNALAIAVWKKGQIYDYAERLHFYVSGLRMDNTTSANMPAYMAKFLTPSKWEQTAMVEMYCHENQMYNASNNTLTSDYVARFESVCNWAVANGFSFGYQMDKIRTAF